MVVTAMLVMGGLALIASSLLALAARFFHVAENPRLAAIKSALPGLNCGACGYVGCEGAAKALLAGKARVTVCPMGGLEVVQHLMRLTGKGEGLAELPTATVACSGSHRMAPVFEYNGAADCRAMAVLYGGWNPCENGCLGGGTCAAVCRFNAIRLDAERRPQVDPSRCRGCGRCVDVCPRGLIRLETLAERLLRLDRTSDCLAPCRQKCPAQIDVPRYLNQLIRGDKAGALQTLKLRNPFPSIVGRTCPHPCENICRRNIADEGVAIGHLQRYLGDWERQSRRRIPLACLPDTGHRVAVVGAGPAGLSCSYFLRRLGHRPTLFELKPQLGGMLRYGIPAYRLPRDVVDWEIDGILALGIEVRTKSMLGRDFTLTELRQSGFKAIFLGLGAWTVPQLCVPGEAVEGVWQSLEFLSAVGGGLSDLKAKRVVVIGESNTTMDCARSSIRLGAAAATVICPREREAMTARKRDIVRAEAEGVRICVLTMPLRIVADPAGQVRQVVCQGLIPDPQKKGKMVRYLPLPDSETLIDADLVITAYERMPDLACLQNGDDAALGFTATPAGTLAAAGVTLLAAPPDIFAAGDMHTGRATVVGAVAGGRMAARSIHHLITSGKIPVPADLHRRVNPRSILKNLALPPGPPKVTLKELPVEVRRRSFAEEVVATITPRQARLEAQRCLQCGTLCYGRDALRAEAAEKATS